MVAKPQSGTTTTARSWHRAFTLAERLSFYQRHRHSSTAMRLNDDLARYHWDAWRDQVPFQEDIVWEQRLATDGLTPEIFRDLVGTPGEVWCLHDTDLPDWAEVFIEAWSATPKICIQGFGQAVAGLIDQAYMQWDSVIRELDPESTRIQRETVGPILLGALVTRLTTMLSRTMALELNIARLRGELQGTTPEARYLDFMIRLADPATSERVWSDYPVLVRQLVIATRQWVEKTVEVCQRLHADYALLQNHFSPDGTLGPLTRIEWGMGDQHDNGRHVAILEFEDGTKIVYKPKPLAVDVHFQALLVWLNQHGFTPALQTFRVYNCGSYGWVEFVPHRGCTDAEQLQRFYTRQGAYLALLYVLNATDFHAENLIAMGEHPMLIDLEALFHPVLQFRETWSSYHEAYRAMVNSVLRVGLLPRRTWGLESGSGIDVSGLGAQDGTVLPFATPRWEGVGTDEIRFTRTGSAVLRTQNAPHSRIEGGIATYAPAILEGFTQMYQILLTHREALLSVAGPIAAFRNDPIRVILRPTRTYTSLLYESFHPDLLGDGLERDRFLDRLWVGVQHRPHYDRVIPTERADLERGDVPLYMTTPSATTIQWRETCLLDGIIETDGYTLVQHHLTHLDSQDMERQRWLIQASLATTVQGMGHEVMPTSPVIASESWTSHSLIEASRQIGHRLAQLAYQGRDEGVAWIGMNLTQHRDWVLNPVGMDLYDGLPGITLFLAYLATITEDETLTTLARRAAQTVRYYSLGREGTWPSIGAFGGWGGIVYLYMHLGALWQEPEWWEEALKAVEKIAQGVGQDQNLDIIGGVSGCIAVLLGLHRVRPHPRLLEVARACGDHLCATSVTQEVGVAWSAPFPSFKPLTGFSHGAAGMGWSLYHLGLEVEDERYITMAQAAITYENHERELLRNNWPDWRNLADAPITAPMPPHPPSLWAWCHGAPGIGLARMDLAQRVLWSPLMEDSYLALRETERYGLGRNDSLCHGDAGNLELYLTASMIPQMEPFPQRMKDLIGTWVARHRKHGYVCGTPLGIETPGLMTGIAGIGYELLRLAMPARIPNVLLLKPPV